METVRANRMKRKLTEKRPVFGVNLSILDPELVEIAGVAGLDYVWMDGEHTNFNWERALACVLAAELHGITPILRPTELVGYREYMIQRALNIGFQGIVVTGVGNPQEMQAILDVMKFPPRGKRGVGEGRVLARVGEQADLEPEVLQSLNEEIFTWILIESVEGVENIDAICALDGVDAAGLGHRDYALDAGLPDLVFDQPAMQAALEAINAAAKKNHKAWSSVASAPEELQQQVAEGALIFTLGRETRVWRQTCNDIRSLASAAGF